ncbi:MAG: ribonuclease R [Verrucomicrobia bacterium]|jgi:ribonuclease R|nr:ribonuclease R [Verrucomicrobiota bacterium]
MKTEDLENQIVALLGEKNRRAQAIPEIADALNLKGKLRKQLPKHLKRLVVQGTIVTLRNGRYSLGEEADLFTGRLISVRSGNGFVDAIAPDTSASVFVSAKDMSTALSGDTVLVRLYPAVPDDDRGRSGKIIRIVERGRHDIVGTLRSTGRFLHVVPIDPVYAQNFYVGETMGAAVGDRVLVRFTHWENRHVSPEGEVIEVLGPADSPSVDTLSIIRHHDLRDEFPEEVLREAEAASARMELPGKRVDLREDLIITIDPKRSRDFDDALSIQREDGFRILGVHIADVSHFVQPGSALDKEARLRGTSVYLPDKVLPMLPEQLSNGICSLNPGRDRLAFSVMLKVDDDGKVVARWFAKTIIRSGCRLTYEQALAVIESKGKGKRTKKNASLTPEVVGLLRDLHKLAQQFRTRRFANNALDLDVAEVEIVTDGEGSMTGLQPVVNDVSHQLVEECMVCANEAVASELASRHIASLARFHDEPKLSKIEELTDLLVGMGYSPGDLTKQRVMAKFLRRIEHDPLAHHVHVAILKSMNRAVYSSTQSGHYGLAKAFYSHFTSPIRRYPDLIVHRQLAACLRAPGGQRYDKPQLASIALHASERENVSDTAERALTEIMKFRYLERDLASGKGKTYASVVVAVTNFGVFVELEQLRIQGLVHISALSNEFLRFNRQRGELRNRRERFGMGDSLKVRVAEVDLDARRLTFAVA